MADPPPTTLSPLRAARLAAGLSLRELARRTGFDPMDISRVERGQRTPWPNLRRKTAEALGAAEADLFPEFAP